MLEKEFGVSLAVLRKLLRLNPAQRAAIPDEFRDRLIAVAIVCWMKLFVPEHCMPGLTLVSLRPVGKPAPHIASEPDRQRPVWQIRLQGEKPDP